MFCQQCLRIFDVVNTKSLGTYTGLEPQLFGFGDLHKGWAGSHHIEKGSFENAVAGRCYICYVVFRDCNREVRKRADHFRTFYEMRPSSDHRFELDITVEVLSNEASGARDQLVDGFGTFLILPREAIGVPSQSLGLTDNTFSGKCKAQVREWLENCDHDKSHALCQQDWRTEHKFPFRLMKIGPEGDDCLKLVTYRNDSFRPRYITMSHCWQSREAMPVQLLRSTMASFQDGLSVDSLPKKFQDAVSIARWMNINYLWVDALCIIQDDGEDWHAQSAVMGDIYIGSYCNIAATTASAEKGCFTDRSVDLVEPHPTPSLGPPIASSSHVIGYNDFWCNSLLDTTLHTRAWVLQERLLSPRTIYFGQEQMFWECRNHMACEAYPAGIPEPFRNHRTRSWRYSDRILNPANRKVRKSSLWSIFWTRIGSETTNESATTPHWAYSAWSQIVERYMDCDLTFGKDKLVAISGLAKKVAEVTDERYLAGHWNDQFLPQSLLWFVPSRRQANNKPSTRPQAVNPSAYRAPSWSWASIDGQVTWNWPADFATNLISIQSVEINQSSTQQTFDSISSASMQVNGQLHAAHLSIAGRHDGTTVIEDGRYSLKLTRKLAASAGTEGADMMTPKVYLDEPMLPLQDMAVYMLPVCTEWQGGSDYTTASVAGLLLKKSEDTSRGGSNFERVGVFVLNEAQAEEMRAGSPETHNITLS